MAIIEHWMCCWVLSDMMGLLEISILYLHHTLAAPHASQKHFPSCVPVEAAVVCTVAGNCFMHFQAPASHVPSRILLHRLSDSEAAVHTNWQHRTWKHAWHLPLMWHMLQYELSLREKSTLSIMLRDWVKRNIEEYFTIWQSDPHFKWLRLFL